MSSITIARCGVVSRCAISSRSLITSSFPIHTVPPSPLFLIPSRKLVPPYIPVRSHHTSYYFLMKAILTAIASSDHTVDEITLEPLLSFAARYVSHPRYARLIALVAQKILDLYSSVLGQSDSTDELFLRLHRQVCTLSGHIIKVILTLKSA